MYNQKFVSQILMQSNLVGPLCEIIVMNAIIDYTKRVVDAGEVEVTKQFKKGMISGRSWFAGCKEIQEKINGRK